MGKHSILLVSRSKNWIRNVRMALPASSFRLSTAQNSYVALEKVSCHRYDATVVMLPLPMMGEAEFLRRLKGLDGNLPVLTLYSTKSERGTGSRKPGASLTAPGSGENLEEMILEVLNGRTAPGSGERPFNAGPQLGPASAIIACSEAMRKILETMERVKDKDIPILLEGESGTGKDLVARTIHFTSRRRDYPFVPVNCAAIPDSLLESELFGHEKGAFTGAVTRRIGKFEQANQGTLFLDEIADMSPGTQAKLLRAIETREFERIGGSQSIRVTTRIVCATNQSLHERMEKGFFRRDLYYRVAAFRMVLPPLRERPEDIPVLARHFLTLFGEMDHRHLSKMSRETMKILLNHDWKGNVRELANGIHRACVLCEGDTILPEHLPPEMVAEGNGKPEREHLIGGAHETWGKIVPLRSLEAQAMERALEESSGNVSVAAKGLGMGRATFYRKAEKYNIGFRNRN